MAQAVSDSLCLDGLSTNAERRTRPSLVTRKHRCTYTLFTEKSMRIKWVALSMFGALAASAMFSKPALAEGGCTFNITRTCEVINAGQICWGEPVRCDDIIIEIIGVKFDE